MFWHKLQALVYNTLPSTTAIVDYAIGLKKLSANEKKFDDAQAVVSLQQATQMIYSVISDHVVYASTNKTKIV